MKKSFLNDILIEKAEKEVDNSFTNFLCGLKKMKSIKESISEERLSKELSIFIESCSTLIGEIPTIKKTLFKHWKKGEYNSELAERSWERLVTKGAKIYSEEIGKEPRLWKDMFSASLRQNIVKEFEQSFYLDLKKGKVNIEELFNE